MNRIALTPSDVGALVRAARKFQKLRQDQLAGLAGVGVRFIVDLEAGKPTAQIGKTLKILETLGYSLTITPRSRVPEVGEAGHKWGETVQLDLLSQDFARRAVSPFLELGAYESLWDEQNASFKSIAEMFAKRSDAVPSDFVDPMRAASYANDVHSRLREAGVESYGVRVHGAGDYPDRLRVADYPVELLYFQGWWELVNSPRSVAVVGTRNPSNDALARTRKLVKALLEDDFTIVSGLATGVDTAAHETAIENGGRTIAVLGTPLSKSYPKSNAKLQKKIAKDHLLISQVPVKRYANQKNPTSNNFFFPERNITMSALTGATIIVEAGETSGTLVQARHALKQGRGLFILDSNFRNETLKWPHIFQERGAIRVVDYDDIRRHLVPLTAH
jgi:DNA processing protein